ncbi:MAG: glutamine synthetase family protein [Chloroflexota bacterium]|nr:glutamine synthetase family protein [Chloroflexota bacterium]
MRTKNDILSAIDEQHVQFVLLWFTDIAGMIKSVTVPTAKVADVIDYGLHFDGSSVEGFGRVAESDMVLSPDLNTFIALPWNGDGDHTARMICTVRTPQGNAFIGDSRNILIDVLKDAESLGFTFKTGLELEFFLFQRDANGTILPLRPHDDASYFDSATDETQAIRRKLISTLIKLGIRVDSSHHEIGSGQHEIDLDYNDALVSADNLLTARYAIKSTAQRSDLHCTFMPRPSEHLPGSGMHTHQSLHDKNTDANVFVDLTHEYGLSETARYFLAGQLCHARALCAILAPLVNSYKRLAVSFEAPKYISWAHVNRAGAALIRVPHIAPGKEANTRLELRCPDPSCNPYLAMAVMLAAGLDGIRQRMPLTNAMEESLLRPDRAKMRTIETLPTSLSEALDALAADDVIMSALGEFVGERYIAVKRQELDEYHRQITPWEQAQYLNRY